MKTMWAKGRGVIPEIEEANTKETAVGSKQEENNQIVTSIPTSYPLSG